MQLPPPGDLYEKIIEQIRQEALLRLKRRIFFFGGALAASVAGFVLASVRFYSQINDSGFIEMLSLASSDFKTVLANFSDYLLSLAESFPIMTLAFFGAVLALMLFFLFNLLRSASEFKALKAVK